MNTPRLPLPRGRDLLIGLSLANLWFIRLWGEVLAVAGPDAYFSSIHNADIYALMLNVALLGGALAFGATWLRRRGAIGRRVMVTGFTVVLLAQLNHLGPELNPGVLSLVDLWKSGKHLDVILPLVVVVTLVTACVRWPQRALRLAVGFVLVLSPFVAVTFGRAALILLQVNPSEALASKAPSVDADVPRRAGPRVVLVVMDAMGRRHAIDARPDSIEMPALDRLRAEGLDATQVTQIGRQTKISVPGMLSGLEVEASEPEGADELILTLEDGRTVPWSETDNLIDEAQSLGGVGVIAGWYHPYCRIFEHSDACETYPARTVGSRARDTGFWRAVAEQQLALVPYLSLWLRQVEIVETQREDLAQAAVLGERGFVFLHVIAPHTPWIWDHEEQDYTLTEFSPDGMFFNLELADVMLGEIREAMERAGQWDSTAVIVTSDHVAQYRPRWIEEPEDTRVPFIVKLAGARGGLSYARALDGIVVHELASALLRDEIPDYASLVAWLDAHAAPRDSTQ
ncbi:sulfatase-like hydrolase/transferase [Pseudogemmatithrix spongiicola]|uniref:Sulfatase-like hydrolase/transferase n=1 Tax=Pseudogemmatithrix spongiicola TaxID=3062599 RepID=A0AA49Q773_9BACT|nr:sulfatase-like hydrolase/transferase [Gemmatimonadaceae bacterium 'strain 138']WKW14772.1 sulfatase-like hydrolase/transferase [Gemmatimonadaceae bacterium 'strain 318']